MIDAGGIDCVMELVPVYENGRGVDVDLGKAAELYKKASELTSDAWKRQFYQVYYGMLLIRGR